MTEERSVQIFSRIKWCLLIGLTLLVFSPILFHDFIPLDDQLNIYENPYFTQRPIGNLERFWVAPYEGMYIPVTYTTWGVLSRLTGSAEAGNFNPFLFHFFSLIVHGLNVVLVYLFLNRLLKNNPLNWLAALIFGLHPLQVESVAWATALKDELAVLFSVSGAILYFFLFEDKTGRYLEEGPDLKEPRTILLHLAATVCFLSGMLSKPSVAAVPVALIVLGWGFLKLPVLRQIKIMAPWLLITGGVSAVALRIQPPEAGQWYGIWKHLSFAVDSLGFYLLKLLAPFNLSPVYGRLPEQVFSDYKWVVHAGIVVGVSAVFLVYRERKYMSLAAAFVILMLPISGLVPFGYQYYSTVADRYMYLPMVVVCLGAGLGLKSLKLKPIAPQLLGMILIIFAFITVHQIQYWKSGNILFKRALDLNDHSVIANKILGELKKDTDLTAAMMHYQNALAYRPDDVEALNELGNIYLRQDNVSEAMPLFQKAVAVDENVYFSWVNLGSAYLKTSRINQAEEAFNKAIELNPSSYSAHTNLANILRYRKNYQEAIANLVIAIGLDPTSWEPHNNLGNIRLEMGDPKGAVVAYETAAKLNPNAVEPWINIGNAYLEMQDYEQALPQFERALTIQAVNLTALINLGFCHQQLNHVKAAIEGYKQVLKINPDVIQAHFNLALIYEAMGEFTDAVSEYKDVLRIQPGNKYATEGLNRLTEK